MHGPRGRAALRHPAAAPAARRAHVAFAEQFATAVGSVSDAQVDALREHGSDEEVYEFVSALYVLEMTRRVELVAGRVLS